MVVQIPVGMNICTNTKTRARFWTKSGQNIIFGQVIKIDPQEGTTSFAREKK